MLHGTLRPDANEEDIIKFKVGLRDEIVVYTASAVPNGSVPSSWKKLERAAAKDSALPLERGHIERLHGLGFYNLFKLE
jgi:hypothetical protein